MSQIVLQVQGLVNVATPLVVALLCLYAYHRRLSKDDLLLWGAAHLALALTFLTAMIAPPQDNITDLSPGWLLALALYSVSSSLILCGVLAIGSTRFGLRFGFLMALVFAIAVVAAGAVSPVLFTYIGLPLIPFAYFVAAVLLIWRRSVVHVLAGLVLLLRTLNGTGFVIAVIDSGSYVVPGLASTLSVFLNFLTGVCLLAVAVENAWTRMNAALAEARDAHQESDAILDMAPISILRKDRDRRVIRASRYAVALAASYGAERDDMIGVRSSDTMPKPAADEMDRMDMRLLSDPSYGPLESEVTFVAPDGRSVTLLVRKHAMTDEEGHATGIISAALDITNLKQIEARLREQILLAENASKAKSDFLANMSHELRTPLNGISGFAEMLSAGYLGPLTEKQKEYLENILTSSHSMLALVSRILDLSRLDSGAIALQRKPVDLGAVVAEVLADAAPMAAEHDIELHSRILPAIASVDPVAMRQVLTNLLSNAIRFNRPGGKVSVDMRQQDGRTAIVVSDTGIGMTPAQIAAAGDPFLRTDPFKARSGGGAGLGLAISRGLVELHGGDLVIASVSDSGTTVTISL